MIQVSDAEIKNDNGLNVEMDTPEVDAHPPATDDNPFSLVDGGGLELPEFEDWECSGTVHQTDTNDHSIAWYGEHTLPGFPDSTSGIIAIEAQTGEDGVGVTFTPFKPGHSYATPHLVAEYDRLRTALRNVEAALERIPEMGAGEMLVIQGDGYKR